VTEYNWGAEGNINGATAQADILGIFGRGGLDLATRWTTPTNTSPTYLAMKLYRNYDGHKSTFGDTSVLTTTPSPDDLSAFGAVRSSDGALTLMVINKNLTNATPIAATLTNFSAAGIVQRWQLTGANVISPLPSLSLTNAVLNDVVPSQSITLYVAPAATNLFSLKIAGAAAGQVALFLNGTAGQTYVLQSSTNLLNWLSVNTNTLISNSWEMFMPPTNGAPKFYRGVYW